MKQFQSEMKAKAHLKKIKNAKATLPLKQSKTTQNKLSETEDMILLRLYDSNQTSSIPIYRLLKQAGLQQYTRQLIIRGYGVNLSKLALLREADRLKLFQEIKVLPGHATKLNQIIQMVSKQSKGLCDSGLTSLEANITKNIFSNKEFMDELDDADDYEKQLERVLNEYTPKDNKGFKRETKNVFKKDPNKLPSQYASENEREQKDPDRSINKGSKITNTTGRMDSIKKPTDSVKRVSLNDKKSTVSRTSGKDVSTKPTIKKDGKPSITPKMFPPGLKAMSVERKKQKQPLQVDLKTQKIKTLYMSAEGAVMTSTIVNLDLQEECYCISAYLQNKIKPAERKKVVELEQSASVQQCQSEKGQIDEEEVGNILRQSYLHPLYQKQNQEEEVEEEIDREEEEQLHAEQSSCAKRLEQSSFLGGNESVHFGLQNQLDIFDEPCPTEVDYYVPTIDSLANFIKNVVVSAKMEKQVPILAVLYVQKFLAKTKIDLTSINYKRLLVSCLLLASKVWDDESFETPSFSHTFPDYTTVLLNELQKQILVAIDYSLKLNKKEYAILYYKLRQCRQPTGKSYQNRNLIITRVLDLQKGVKKLYRSDFHTKRKSF